MWLPVRADLDRQHRIEQQHAALRPGVELPDLGRLERRRAGPRPAPRRPAPASAAGPCPAENARPSAWPAVGYGSWPMTTTFTSSGATSRSARNGSSGAIGRSPETASMQRRTAVEPLARPARQHGRPRRRQRRERRVEVARLHANRPASAAPGSGARMKASPTRKACTPAARMRCDVGAAQDAALGDQQPVGRHARQQRQRGVERDLEGAQVAVVDADQRRPAAAARARARRASCTSTSTAMPSAERDRLEVAPSARRRGRRRSAGCSRRRSRATRRPARRRP